MINSNLKAFLNNASAKALATNGSDGINVVPVSMIKANDDSIWLFDFFMDKTAKNTQTVEQVALTAWTDMKGLQIKAQVRYINSGDDFTTAVNWVATQNPSRILKGLLILKPIKVYDISPGGAFLPTDLVV